MKYSDTGVNYDALDPFKRACQKAARETALNVERLGFRVRPESYGESAFLIESTDTVPYVLAHVEEGLGTKNLVADQMGELTGKSYYDQIAECTVAMIVNDLITLGALPLSIAMHAAVGESAWFTNDMQVRALVAGWKRACDLSRAAWGGGETPTLKGIVTPGTILLSGSATGVIKPAARAITPHMRAGDAIILIRSSGIHANGLTLARKIAEKLPEGYLTKLSDDRTYGESLLDATYIYVGAIEECLTRGIDLHYAANMTGHGWRKLMRAPEEYTYTIDTLPPALPIFDFIQKHGPLDDEEAYGTLNMGAGFAVFVSEEDADATISAIEAGMQMYKKTDQGPWAFRAGHVKKGEKQVLITPKSLVFKKDTLAVR